MTTQTLTRLIVATVAVGLLTVLLFSGPTTSAAKADRTAPTTPTNLVVTAITDTTVALRWSPSTDNSGKFSYRVKINKLNSPFSSLEQPVSQTQTSYTATYLLPNSSYSFVVYAVDGSGNARATAILLTPTPLCWITHHRALQSCKPTLLHHLRCS